MPAAASRSRAERFTAAATRRPLEPARPLPRALQAVAREVGVEPAGVRMTSGPATRAALRAAQAPGASRGTTLHLRSTSASSPADREVVAHELAHAAARVGPQGARGPSPPAAPAARTGGGDPSSAQTRASAPGTPSTRPRRPAPAAGPRRLPRAHTAVAAGPSRSLASPDAGAQAQGPPRGLGGRAAAPAVRVPVDRAAVAGRPGSPTPPRPAVPTGVTTAPSASTPSPPREPRPAPPAVRLFGGSGLGDPEEAVARMVGRAGRGATGSPTAARSAGDELPVAGRGMGASAVREMVATAVAEQLGQAEAAAATPADAATPAGPAAAPRGGGDPAPASTAGPPAAADAPAVSPDVDAIVEQLEERLLTEIERRGGRYQGVF